MIGGVGIALYVPCFRCVEKVEEKAMEPSNIRVVIISKKINKSYLNKRRNFKCFVINVSKPPRGPDAVLLECAAKSRRWLPCRIYCCTP
jgi:hypothetical protein